MAWALWRQVLYLMRGVLVIDMVGIEAWDGCVASRHALRTLAWRVEYALCWLGCRPEDHCMNNGKAPNMHDVFQCPRVGHQAKYIYTDRTRQVLPQNHVLFTDNFTVSRPCQGRRVSAILSVDSFLLRPYLPTREGKKSMPSVTPRSLITLLALWVGAAAAWSRTDH